MVGPTTPSSDFSFLPMSRMGPTPAHLITTTAALRLSNYLRHRHLHLGLLLRSSFKNIHPLKNEWHKKTLQFTSICNSLPTNCMNLFFFNGHESPNNSNNIRNSNSKNQTSSVFNKRQCTNILLAVNVLAYIAQFATQGKLTMWGAKINGLIDRGQLWRLVTSAFLHTNIAHLMINCYSLNSIGPAVENICGPRRYMAIYVTSAIASSVMSYRMCISPSVGASGAIFGLVGSFAVFILRHRNVIKGSQDDLQNIARIIVLNMIIGQLSRGIDNWGHFGGLLGGAAISWLVGPSWKLEFVKGQRVVRDNAPMLALINTIRTKL